MQRNDADNRAEQWRAFWHVNHMICLRSDELVALCRQRRDDAAARFCLFHLADHLLVQAVLKGDAQHRHLLVDERNWPMLHLASRVAFGMDVADFLQLQRAFKGNRIVDAAPQEQEVGKLVQLVRQFQHLAVRFQRAAHQVGEFGDILHVLLVLLMGERTAKLAQVERQQVLVYDAGGKGFGGSNADLWPGVHRDVAVGQAHGLATNGVDDAPHGGFFLAGFLYGCQRVYRLARLGDGQHGGVLIQNRVAIPVFAAVIAFHAHARHVFDEEFAHQAAVIAGAAGHGDDLLDAFGVFRRQLHFRDVYFVLLKVDAATNGIGDAARLLVDFLLHEVLVLALDRADGVVGDVVNLAVHRFALVGDDAVAVGGNGGDLAAFQEDHLARVFQDGADVGRDEVFAIANPQHDAARVADAQRDEAVGLMFADQHDGVCPAQARHDAADGFCDVCDAFFGFLFHQLDDDFGVGFALKDDALGLEFLAQFQVIFKDAVLNHDEIAAHADVRVGVAFRWRAVGGPAGVPHANAARQRLALNLHAQVDQLADIAPQADFALVQHSHAGAVIPAILQPPQTIKDDGGGLLRTDVTHDTTHKFPP